MKVCHYCKNPIDDTDTIGRTDTCLACGSDLHCCLNCRFHDPGAYNECRENQAERVLEKNKSNFCDYFFLRQASPSELGKGRSDKKKVNPLDDLFKK